MEPFTPLGATAAILGLAGKAWDLGRHIHNVYQGTKIVDKNIQNLGHEVLGLASTCDLVHEELASILTVPDSEEHGRAARAYDPNGTLEKCIRDRTTHCGSTIEELGMVAERLWPRKKKFIDRTARQLRLQDAKEQIDDLRARIRSHTDALHTVLHVLTIKVAHVSPVQAMGQLSGNLDDLRDSISRIEAGMEQRPVRENVGEGDTPALAEYARGTMRSGMTLLDGSVAGSTVGVDSVIGGEQAAVINKTVAEWILSSEPTGHGRQDVLLEHIADVNSHSSGSSASCSSSQVESECDSDDDQAEFATAAFKAGSCAFDKQEWRSATEYLVISKKAFKELPVNHRESRTLFELQYKVAVCSYHLDSTDDAETEIQGLLQQLEPESDEQRVQQYDVYHMLAEIYVRQNKLDTAKEVCKQTLKARSRLLGKKHAARFESIALLSRICGLLGEERDAEVYLLMIPDDKRDRLITAMSALRPSDTDWAAYSSPMEAQIPSVKVDAVEGLHDLPARSTGYNRSRKKKAPKLPSTSSVFSVSDRPRARKHRDEIRPLYRTYNSPRTLDLLPIGWVSTSHGVTDKPRSRRRAVDSDDSDDEIIWPIDRVSINPPRTVSIPKRKTPMLRSTWR
jgi:hypothetical protein